MGQSGQGRSWPSYRQRRKTWAARGTGAALNRRQQLPIRCSCHDGWQLGRRRWVGQLLLLHHFEPCLARSWPCALPRRTAATRPARFQCVNGGLEKREEKKRGDVIDTLEMTLASAFVLLRNTSGLFGSAPHLTSQAGTHSVLRFEAKRIRQHLCSFSR